MQQQSCYILMADELLQQAQELLEGQIVRLPNCPLTDFMLTPRTGFSRAKGDRADIECCPHNIWCTISQ